MQLSQLRSFLVVLEESSLTRAAARLHIGQPALTRQMAALEQDIGARLLERSHRGVLPTAAGQSLAATLARPLTEIEAAIVQARQYSNGKRTTLRIGYLQSLARGHLNPALAALRAAYPALRIELTDLCAGGQIRGLREGQIDVGLMGTEARALAHEFYSRTVQQIPVVVAMPADHALSSRPVLKLADLRGLRFVGKEVVDAADYNDWVNQLCRRAGFRPRIVQRADSTSQLLSLVVSEGAVAILPEIAVDPSAPYIVTRRVIDPFAKWEFIAVWQRGRTAPAVRALLDALPTLRSVPGTPALISA